MTFEAIEKANKTLKSTDIKGKKYIEVNERIKAFRTVCPNGAIITEIISLENGVCTMKASIYDDKQVVLATGFAQEKQDASFINKTSYIENCETSAVGRALGMCGFGIDTSVASYEEVANAIENQEKSKEKTPQKPAELTFEQIEGLVQLAKKKGLKEPTKTLCRRYKVNALSELTAKQYKECVAGLEKMTDTAGA